MMLPTSAPPGPLPAVPKDLPGSRSTPEFDSAYRELFEFAPVAYHEIDAAGILRRVNQTECRMLGYTPAEMIGNPVWQFVAADQQEQCRHAIERKIAGDEPVAPFERDFLRRDG